MRERPATDADLVYVLERLCAAHRAEHKAMGLDYGTALARARGFLRRGHSVTFDLRGEPACVFGAFPDSGVHTTWMLATEPYFSSYLVASLTAKRHLQRLVRQVGPLFTSTLSPHPEVGRWLTVLGYRKVAEDGALQVFAYR